jgi:hypothetical protein
MRIVIGPASFFAGVILTRALRVVVPFDGVYIARSSCNETDGVRPVIR